MRARRDAEVWQLEQSPSGSGTEREKRSNEFILNFDEPSETPVRDPEPAEPVTPVWSSQRWFPTRHRAEEQSAVPYSGPTTPVRERSLWSTCSPINVKTSRANYDSYDSPGPESDSDDGVTSSSGSLWESASPQRKLKAVNSTRRAPMQPQGAGTRPPITVPEYCDSSASSHVIMHEPEPQPQYPIQTVRSRPSTQFSRRRHRRTPSHPAVHAVPQIVGPEPLPGVQGGT
ncbi:hypothetical protein V1505DRAFT_388484 [Lipomyces doorenjongii]